MSLARSGLAYVPQFATMRAMIPEADITLDTCGLLCPEPVMLLHNVVRDANAGEVIKVIATDPSTTRDIPRFCHFLGHELIVEQQEGGNYLFYIRKG